MTKAILAFLLLAAAWCGCLSSKRAPSISHIVTSYTNYDQITKTAVLVNPELAMLCVGISKEAVDAARKESGPHANTAILVYMNDLAARAFRTNNIPFPVGAVIVKQKTTIGYFDKNFQWVHAGENGVGGMVKRAAGYDPEHGDWEYFYFENPAKIESGRISSCVQCHEAAKSKDYVFGSWNKRNYRP